MEVNGKTVLYKYAVSHNDYGEQTDEPVEMYLEKEVIHQIDLWYRDISNIRSQLISIYALPTVGSSVSAKGSLREQCLKEMKRIELNICNLLKRAKEEREIREHRNPPIEYR